MALLDGGSRLKQSYFLLFYLEGSGKEDEGQI